MNGYGIWRTSADATPDEADQARPLIHDAHQAGRKQVIDDRGRAWTFEDMPEPVKAPLVSEFDITRLTHVLMDLGYDAPRRRAEAIARQYTVLTEAGA